MGTIEYHKAKELIQRKDTMAISQFMAAINQIVDEKGIDKKTGKVVVEIDPLYFRPAEVDILLGDYSKAKKKLGWKPKVKFKELVKIMVEHDFKEESKKIRQKDEIPVFSSRFESKRAQG